MIKKTVLGVALIAATNCTTRAQGPLNQSVAETPKAAHPSATASQRAAYEDAQPVFARHCARCHSSAGKNKLALRHFSMDTYPFGGHHAGDMADTIRKVLGATGQRATMPADRPGVVRGAELATILKWADAFEGSRASSRSTPKHEHEHEHEQSGHTH